MPRTAKKSKKITGSADAASPLMRMLADANKNKMDVSEHVVEVDESIFTKPRPHLATGSFIVDYLISGPPRDNGVHVCPGWPRGTICRLYGKEGAGKTTLALVTAASTCQRGGTVLYVDFEQEVDIPYARDLGVPVMEKDKFILLRPETLEEGIRYIISAAEMGVDLIIIDSVGAGVPEAIMNRSLSEDATQDRLGRLAAVWSAMLPKMKTRLAKSNASVIGICQLRANVSTGPKRGKDYTVQGGNAWAFYNSLSMYLRPGFKTKSKEDNALSNKVEDSVIGFKVVARLDKCKVSRQAFHEETFYLRSGEGIDDVSSIIEMLTNYGLVKKSGAWYSWQPPGDIPEVRGQGMDKFRAAILEDPELVMLLKQVALPLLGNNKVSKAEAEMFDEGSELSPEEMKEILSKQAEEASDIEVEDLVEDDDDDE